MTEPSDTRSADLLFDGKRMAGWTTIYLDQRSGAHDLLQVDFPLQHGEDPFLAQEDIGKLGQRVTLELEAQHGRLEWSGLLTGVSARWEMGQQPAIQATAHAGTFLLESPPRFRSFPRAHLGSIIREVLSPYPTDVLSAELSSLPDAPRRPYTVQYGESDFRFLMGLASEYGFWLHWDGRQLIVGKPAGQEFELREDSGLLSYEQSRQAFPSAPQIMDTDYRTGRVYTWAGPGNAGPPDADDPLGVSRQWCYLPPVMQVSVHPSTPGTLAAVGSTRLEQHRNRMVLLTGKSENPMVLSGGQISLAGRSWKVYESHHTIRLRRPGARSDFDYENRFVAGLASRTVPFLSTRDPRVVPMLETGIVVENDDGGKHLGRVRVQLPWQRAQEELIRDEARKRGQTAPQGTICTPWIRVVSSNLGAGRGLHFLPEKGDEVLVAYERGDPQRPVVLGSLLHGQDSPARHWANPSNNKKGIRTRSGNEVLFCDEDGKEEITIITRGRLNLLAREIFIGTRSPRSTDQPVTDVTAIQGTTVKLNCSS